MESPSNPSESGPPERSDAHSGSSKRLDRVLADYIAARSEGRVPDRAALLSEHPDLAEEIEEYFRDEDAVAGGFVHVRHLALQAQNEVEAKTSKIASLIGDYELLDEGVRGGMGVVYRARHRSVGRTVALKTLVGGPLATDDLVDRFHREVRACAQLEHPRIVPIYEIGISENLPFYTMQYLDGGDLAEAASGAPSSAAEFKVLALRIAEVARAVHFAHEHGVLHRDLKPGNILVDTNGDWYVSDFGLAAFIEDDSRLTRSGDALGSPSYMSPEQAEGRRSAISVRSDVYSLGAILYELITREPPFRGASNFATLRQVVEMEPDSPRSRNTLTPPDLEAVCLKCLAKSPAERYDSAAALADDLERFARARTIMARSPNAIEKARRWARRNKWAIATCAFFFANAVALGCFAFLWRAERNVAIEQSRSTLLAQARLRRGSGVPGQRVDGLRDVRAAARIRPGLDARNEAAACRVLTDIVEVERSWSWHDAAASFQDVAVDRGYRRVARADSDSKVRVLDVETGELLSTLEIGDGRSVTAFAWSHDANFLAARLGQGPDGPLRVWKIPDGAVTIDSSEPVNYRAIEFHPSRNVLAVGRKDRVELIDLTGGKTLRVFSPLPFTHFVRFSDDGRRLAVAEASPNFRIVDCLTATISPPRASRSGILNIIDIAWRPDGEQVAICGDGSMKVEIWNTVHGGFVRALSGPENGIPNVEYSADGKVVACVDWSTIMSVWHESSGRKVLSTIAEFTTLQRGTRGDIFGYSYRSPMSSWRLIAAPECRSLRDSLSFNYSIAMRPDGRILAAGGPRGVLLWDLLLDERIGVLDCGFTRGVHFSSDGDLLTAGHIGAACWKLEINTTTAGDVLVAERVSHRPGNFGHSSLGDGWRCDAGRLAVLHGIPGGWTEQVALLDLASPASEPTLFTHRLVTEIALDPSGRWLVTLPRIDSGEHARVWNAASGALEKELEHRSGRLAFFADGTRLFVAGDDRLVIHDTGSWREIERRDIRSRELRPVAVSPLGTMVAVVEQAKRVRLLDADDLEDLATLTLPLPSRISVLAFSADGASLACATVGVGVIVWDLRLLREGLSRHGLDWNGAPFPAPPEYDKQPRSLRLEQR